MSEVLGDLEGVVCMIDDVLVHGRSQEEHDEHLFKVLEIMPDTQQREVQIL